MYQASKRVGDREEKGGGLGREGKRVRGFSPLSHFSPPPSPYCTCHAGYYSPSSNANEIYNEWYVTVRKSRVFISSFSGVRKNVLLRKKRNVKRRKVYHLLSKTAWIFKLAPLARRYKPFAWWRHFTTTTRILQEFAFLCKLGLLLSKPHSALGLPN